MRNFLLLLCLPLLAAPLRAQSLFDNPAPETRLEWMGYARGAAWGGAQQFDYAHLFGEAALQGKLSRGKAVLFADARLREGLLFGEQNTVLQLKEAYAGYQSPKLDLFLGNQIVAWGRTDGFNPTNCITPRDYFFLSPEPDDQTLPNFMLRAKYRLKPQIVAELIAIPVFRPSVYRYDLFIGEENARFDDGPPLSQSINNGALAAKMNFEFSRIGFSLSYFHGYDPFYGFSVQSVDLSNPLAPAVVNQPAFYQKDALGADFAIPLGAWIARGEMAASFTRDYAAQMHVPNPDLYYVLGLERSFGGITAIAQYVGKYVFDFAPIQPPVLTSLDPEPLAQYINDLVNYESTQLNRRIFQQQKQTNHALFLSLNRAFARETLRAELSGYYNFSSEEHLVRGRLTWQISDMLSAGLGAHLMGGQEGYIFDLSKGVLNGIFTELKVSF
jgi:hypothetical protein